MWMIQMKTNPAHRAGRVGARQIYEALRDQIMARVYGIDGLLPSSRALAGAMGVARWTEPPRGLVANFRYGELAPSDFPILAWKKAVTAAMARKPERLAYDDPCGALRLRTALQGYLWRSRSVRCEVDQIVVVNGSQQGL